MPDHYFHYTSRQAAQSVGSMGKIETGASGGIYLSLDVYSEGTRATDALVIEGKAVEVVALIPGSLLTPRPTVGVVLPLYDPVSGALRRHGGGSQAVIPGPLTASDVRWLALAPP